MAVEYKRGRFYVTLADGREFVSNRFGVCWPKDADSPTATAAQWTAMLAVTFDDRRAVEHAITGAGFRKRYDKRDYPYDTKRSAEPCQQE